MIHTFTRNEPETETNCFRSKQDMQSTGQLRIYTPWNVSTDGRLLKIKLLKVIQTIQELTFLSNPNLFTQAPAKMILTKFTLQRSWLQLWVAVMTHETLQLSREEQELKDVITARWVTCVTGGLTLQWNWRQQVEIWDCCPVPRSDKLQLHNPWLTPTHSWLFHPTSFGK